MSACDHGLVALSLPGRAEAEQAITALMGEARLGFVLAVVGAHIPLMNEQLGYAEGDRALEALAVRLAAPRSARRKLFRWSANAFVIVSDSLRKIADERNVDDAITALFAAWTDESPAALFERIDHYIAARLACSQAA
jgi:GGDEF domain-containing protein